MFIVSLIIIAFSLGVIVGEIIMLIISRKERKQYRAPLQKMNNSDKRIYETRIK